MLNWGMLKHPMNWVTVVLMVLIAGIAIHFFMSYQTGQNPADVVKS
jgi:hypothetical protein